MKNPNSENPRPIVDVDTPALAGCVPRLDRASEVLPQAVVGEVTGSSDPSNPVRSILDRYIKAGESAEKNQASLSHTLSHSELVLIGRGAVAQAESMVRVEQSLKEQQNLRKEEMKQKETSGRKVANKCNWGDLQGLLYRLRYSWNFFCSSFKSFDQEKLNWYLTRKS